MCNRLKHDQQNQAAGGIISAALLSTPGASAFYKGGLTVWYPLFIDSSFLFSVYIYSYSVDVIFFFSLFCYLDKEKYLPYNLPPPLSLS